MGLYIDHGIEYAADTPDGKHVVLIESRDLDTRLRCSNYFKLRSDAWFRPPLHRPESVKVERDGEVDISLTDAEKQMIEEAVRVHGFARHGWYDTVRASSSLT